MSWGALGLTAHADMMGNYCEHIQKWLDQAKKELTERGLLNRFEQIAGMSGDLFNAVTISYPINDIDRQLSILALAIATGSKFEFNNGKFANDWIFHMISGCEESFENNLSDYLTGIELLQLAVARI